MGNAENAPTRSAFRWVPRLVLLGVVVAFGYLYLHSVEKQGVDKQAVDSAPSIVESAAELSPLPISALPETQYGSRPSKADEAGAAAGATVDAGVDPIAEVTETDQPAVASKVVSESRPVKETESAVFADSLMGVETPPKQASASAAVSPSPEVPLAEPLSSLASSPAMMAPPAPASWPAEPRQERAERPLAEALAMPGQVASPPSQEKVEPALEVAVAEAGESLNQRPALAREAMEQRRARALARHEAMRRVARERMRRHVERMQFYGPVGVPYGYPGYMAGSMPGYAPGVYGSPW